MRQGNLQGPRVARLLRRPLPLLAAGSLLRRHRDSGLREGEIGSEPAEGVSFRMIFERKYM